MWPHLPLPCCKLAGGGQNVAWAHKHQGHTPGGSRTENGEQPALQAASGLQTSLVLCTAVMSTGREINTPQSQSIKLTCNGSRIFSGGNFFHLNGAKLDLIPEVVL